MARISLLRFCVGLVLVVLGFVVAASPGTALPHAVAASPAPMGAAVASVETGTTGTHTSTTSPAKTRVCVARAYDASRDAPRSRPPARGPRLAKKAVRKGPIPDEVANNLPEQLALGSARAGNGTVIMRNLRDAPRLVDNYGPGRWVKMQNVARGQNQNVTVHWCRNLNTGVDVELKFTQRYFGNVQPSGVAKSPTGTAP